MNDLADLESPDHFPKEEQVPIHERRFEMILLGLFCMAAALLPLYLKYRVVLTGEKCKGKITGIAEQRGGYSVGGYAVKKRAYLVKISGKQYYTAHGCLFAPLGRKQIGKEIWVYRDEKFGREVFQCRDVRIEALSLILFSAAVVCFWCA